VAVGAPAARLEGAEKVSGRARYTEDLRLPGMLHARLVLSPHPRARIARIPKEAALEVPGIVAVYTGADLPIGTAARRALAKGEVRYTGEPVAAVLAESEAAAADAVERLASVVEYEVMTPILDPMDAMRPDAPAVTAVILADAEAAAHAAASAGAEDQEKRPSNITNHVTYKRGDVEAGLREADLVIERTYTTPRVHQLYIEPQCAVATTDPASGHVTIYTATQGQFFVREQVAKALDLPLQSVRVVPLTIGGGFGGKIQLIQPMAAALALASNRPVRLILTRSEDLLLSTPAPECVMTLKTGVKKDGTLTAIEGKLIFDSGSAPAAPTGIGALLMGGYYRVPHFHVEAFEVLTNKPAVGAYRAPGATQANFAMESQMDIMGRALGLDPVAFRLHNAAAEGDPMPDGKPWNRIGLREVLERLQRHPAWTGRETGDGVGYGIAVGGWPGGVESASACMRANTDGTFQVVTGAIDVTGTSTTFAQIAADVLGLPVDKIQVITSDTDTAPYAGMSAGSKTLYTVGAALQIAAEDARRQILEIAAKEMEAHVDDLEIANGQVRVKGAPGRSLAVAEVAARSMRFGAKHPPIFGAGSVPSPKTSPGFAAHLVKARVDRETGAVKILGHVVFQDVGFAVNPAAVDGQIRGGAVQAIGWGLIEAMRYDESGTLLTSTLSDYPLPRASDVPPMDVEFIEVRSQYGPYGAKGVGEPPIISGGPAIANAVADACGVREVSLPITAERLLAALEGGRPRA